MFGYDDAVAKRYPTIRAGVIHATRLANRASSPELLDEYRAAQQAASDRLHTIAIAELPSIVGWRRAFARFGAKPTQHRNAAEALLRRLAKHGGIPTISTLVDIGNLVSIRYAIPVTVFDLANVAGSITVRFATGAELFTDLIGRQRPPDPGEVIFVDSNNVVCARRWCWRPERPERHQHDHGRHARRHRRPSRHRHRRRRGGPRRPRLAACLASAQQPDHVVSVVSHQSPDWNRRRHREHNMNPDLVKDPAAPLQ